MTKSPLLLALALTAAPLAAWAMPAVGDIVGTNPTDATAALAAAGCTVTEFEAEGGKIEAKCTDEAGKKHEVYIDPKTGAVTEIKMED
ncbi:PepSY domain-containing protein [Pseudotabrizicola sp. L79]|uniref:PepSY domain-containing protein n=1 Tax=Pseudotabrizicola sp. L79 TaxID=3118402 RepID=UPI002F930572